ncbi:hypothetical protein [Panacagrimonas sp.]|uniref:hypothetical protein n=1 Tax=Panacagrimonas sp. TaxID=2480088 RepID=UPI003B51B392
MNLLPKKARTVAELAAALATLDAEIASADSALPALEHALDEAMLAGAGETAALTAVQDAKASLAALHTRRAALERAQAVAASLEHADTLQARVDAARELAATHAKALVAYDKAARNVVSASAEITRLEAALRSAQKAIENMGGEPVGWKSAEHVAQDLHLPSSDAGELPHLQATPRFDGRLHALADQLAVSRGQSVRVAAAALGLFRKQ